MSAGDSPTLGTARAVNGINLLVLAGVAVLLGVAHSASESRADILATLLTIFPTLQASRLEQPDSTRLVGCLTMRHFRVGLLTAVPGWRWPGRWRSPRRAAGCRSRPASRSSCAGLPHLDPAARRRRRVRPVRRPRADAGHASADHRAFDAAVDLVAGR